jgi:hypothetical protein
MPTKTWACHPAMKIPDDAEIPPEKLTRYMLVPRPVDDKSRYLAQAGFTLDDPNSLRDAIRRLAAESEAEEDGVNDYGTFYRAPGLLTGPNGRGLPVVTIWLQQKADGSFRFITLKPDRSDLR